MSVQVEDKSQVTDVKASEEAVVEETTLPIDIKSEEDLERLFDEHPKYLDEYKKIGSKDFQEKYASSKKEEVVDAEEENWLEDEVEDPKEKKEEPVKVDPKPADDIDKKLTETNEKLEAAITELAELKKGKSVEEKKEIDDNLKKIDLSNLTDLPEDIDLLTEEGQNAAKKQFKSMAKALKDVTELLSGTQDRLAEIDEVKEEVGGIKTEAQEREAETAAGDAVVNEFSAIDKVVKANKEVFGGDARPVKDIEDDYLGGIKDLLEKVVKTKSPAFNANGSFTSDAKKVVALYTGNTEKSKKFRAKCESLEVGLPEDIEVLMTVYEVRGIQSELSASDESGKLIKAATYEQAVDTYKGRNLGKFQVQNRVEKRSAREKAVTNRKQFAPETKTGAATADEDISTMPAEEVDRILDKPKKDLTPEEQQKKYTILTKYANKPENEAKYLSGLLKEE